mmetsp:Transcript_4493/g.12778  ORF Transcript_4493/g.12778 Transcript_4493/m.12778 type:complete len:261 (+) Transcript_4493:296-1078(+)
MRRACNVQFPGAPGRFAPACNTRPVSKQTAAPWSTSSPPNPRASRSRAYNSVNDSGSLTKRVARRDGCSVRSPRWDTSQVACLLPEASGAAWPANEANNGVGASPTPDTPSSSPRIGAWSSCSSSVSSEEISPSEASKQRACESSSSSVERQSASSSSDGADGGFKGGLEAPSYKARKLLHQHSANLAYGGVLSRANEMDRGSCVEEQASNATSMAKANGPTASFTADGDGTTDLGARPAAERQTRSNTRNPSISSSLSS